MPPHATGTGSTAVWMELMTGAAAASTVAGPTVRSFAADPATTTRTRVELGGVHPPLAGAASWRAAREPPDGVSCSVRASRGAPASCEAASTSSPAGREWACYLPASGGETYDM